jgi:tetratricopeptide (TPR) repeat protein
MDQAARDRLQSALRDHRAGRLRDAVAVYEDLLRRDPSDADVMQLLGVALGQLGEHEDAARLLAGSLDVKPDRPSVLLNLAQALRSLDREEEALRCCDRALSLDRSLAGAHRMRAASLTKLGRGQEGLASYGEAVRLAPSDPAALTDLGNALDEAGRPRDALDCFLRAIALNPSLAGAHYDHGRISARLGNHAQALQSFERALALQPQNPILHNNRGNALKELGRLPEAVQSFTLALAIEPGNPDTLHNRAVVLVLLGRYAEALADYDDLLARVPENAPDLIGRGTSLVALRRFSEALAPLDRAIALLPRDATAHAQRGVAMLRLDRFADALVSFDRALALRSDLPEVLNNRGVALVELGRPQEALASFVRSLTFDGAPEDAYTNIGLVLRSLGRYGEAASNFDRTLARKPGDARARFASAFVHLTMGDFKRGWPLYEARLEDPERAIPFRDFPVPRWDGREALAGKTLLVHAEQGLGDAIQFCRYVPLLAARGVSVVFEVMPSLKALMRSLPGGAQIICRGERVPAVDFHCPLISLPLALGTDLGSIPAQVPYLAAEPDRTHRWKSQVGALPGLRIGISWQGNPTVERLFWARGRSIPLAALAPLSELPGISLVSLQKGAGSEQLREVEFRDRVVDLSAEIDQGPDAFLDSAAVIAELDLVITSDTSIAHLAGAMAVPTWIALPAVAEWRWLLDRDDSPWYPTARLFRQPRSGDWDSVVAALVTALTLRTQGALWRKQL